MAEPFLSEIKIFSFNYPPRGWAFCNGQLLPINQNQALFALLGTTYGGNGQTNFALPNLQGRVPIHTDWNTSFPLGGAGGSTTVTLSQQQLPAHNHSMSGKAAQAALVGGAVPANTKSLAQAIAATGANPTPVNIYSTTTTGLVALNPASVTNTGGTQAHNNMMPYMVLNFCIALQGIFPSRN
jgi:microcystin-dependent protein